MSNETEKTPELQNAASESSTTLHSKKKLFTPRLIAEIGLMAAILEVSKIALSLIPNVELVSLEIILFTLYLGVPVLAAVWAFVGVELLVWGFGLWTMTYIYVWPVLVVLTLLFRKHEHKPEAYLIFSTLSGAYGLFFGALCAIPFLFIGGLPSAIGMWISGIPYDLTHCAGNFVLCLILFKPLHAVLDRIKRHPFG